MYITEEDLIYYKNDSYLKSIPEIVKTYNIDTANELSSIIDNNGYYGRHKIVKYLRSKKSNNAYKIKIYLPNSTKEYFWPLEGAYCLYNNIYINLPKRRFDIRYKGGMFYVNAELNNRNRGFNEVSTELRYYWKSYGSRMMTDFLKYGVIRNGKFDFHENDIEEIYENLFDSTWVY
jgi:hypothetical protein